MKNKSTSKLVQGNCLSKLFYTFMFRVLKIASQETFRKEHLFEIDDKLKYRTNNIGFQKYYKSKKEKHSLIILIFRWFLPNYIWLFFFSFYGDMINLGIPLVVKESITWFKAFLENSNNASKAFL